MSWGFGVLGFWGFGESARSAEGEGEVPKVEGKCQMCRVEGEMPEVPGVRGKCQKC